MRALLLLLFLAGCGSGESPPENHGYGNQFDAQGASGLKLRYKPALTTSNPEYARLSDPAFYEREFAAVEACTELSAPIVPFVIVTDQPLGGDAIGMYVSHDLILIDVNHLYAIRHEMVHYLLDKTSGNADSAHASTLFGCG